MLPVGDRRAWFAPPYMHIGIGRPCKVLLFQQYFAQGHQLYLG